MSPPWNSSTIPQYAARDSNSALRGKSPEHNHPCSRREACLPGRNRTAGRHVRTVPLCPLSYREKWCGTWESNPAAPDLEDPAARPARAA